jgi:hypothetical protein
MEEDALSKRKKEGRQEPTTFDKARNELFSQIKHCGVLEATVGQRDAWFKDTLEYLTRRYPGMTADQLAQLEALGRRYCEPVIGYGGAPGTLAERNA